MQSQFLKDRTFIPLSGLLGSLRGLPFCFQTVCIQTFTKATLFYKNSLSHSSAGSAFIAIEQKVDLPMIGLDQPYFVARQLSGDSLSTLLEFFQLSAQDNSLWLILCHPPLGFIDLLSFSFHLPPFLCCRHHCLSMCLSCFLRCNFLTWLLLSFCLGIIFMNFALSGILSPYKPYHGISFRANFQIL